MSNNISTRPISELLGMNFFIPAYQRGYRWTERQVTDLLNDINEFSPKEIVNSDEKTWYCLQPIVVKQKGENEWDVIDGQQRLTTTYLILHHLNQGYVESRRKSLFGLKYETRENSAEYLKNELNGEAINDTNIDYYFISSAYKTICDWFKQKGEQFDVNTFESKFNFSTKVIWYETSQNEDSIDIFTRINSGKIPLTNAELIKALFLNSSNFPNTDNEKLRLKQLEIASEWDRIEYSLHNEEFWLFINKEENEKDTRIEFLFELLVKFPDVKNKKGKAFSSYEEYYDETGDNYYTYREFDKKFQTKLEKEIEENWKQVKRYFQTLQDWFNNRELYHKIGFLVTLGENIKALIEKSQTENKTDFIGVINGKIEEGFRGINLDDLKKKDDAKIRKVLLMHNIQTMLNNKEENIKFPFNRYKKKTKDNKGWDIEHIHAIATEIPKKEEQREDWFKYAKEVLVAKLEIEKKKDTSDLSDEEKSKKTKTTSRLEKLIDTQYNSSDFENFFNEISKYVSDEDVDDLPNLALLDLGTNRGYKNEFFSYKRNEIVKKDKTNTFIPICTKNAFMKYYTQTDKIGQMTFWGEADRTAYFDNIKEVLNSYLPTQND